MYSPLQAHRSPVMWLCGCCPPSLATVRWQWEAKSGNEAGVRDRDRDGRGDGLSFISGQFCPLRFPCVQGALYFILILTSLCNSFKSLAWVCSGNKCLSESRVRAWNVAGWDSQLWGPWTCRVTLDGLLGVPEVARPSLCRVGDAVTRRALPE